MAATSLNGTFHVGTIWDTVINRLHALGFQSEIVAPRSLVMRSSTLCLSAVWRTYSYEIDVRFKHAIDHEEISLSDMMLAAHLGEGRPPAVFQAVDDERAVELVRQIAELLITHFRNIIEGDPNAWTSMLANVADQQFGEMNRSQSAPFRAEAADAWRAKDYETYVRCMGKITDELSESESARLEYARRKS
ncbi:MAG: hypothetical protein AAGI53_04835 [Planctomycetota bacterium]